MNATMRKVEAGLHTSSKIHCESQYTWNTKRPAPYVSLVPGAHEADIT